MTEFQPFYLWWREWTVNGQYWAQSFRSLVPQDARTRHNRDTEFRWATNLTKPSVSPLMFVNRHETTTIQPARWGDNR